jgi:cbb3-type cytochrome oxidase subunit 3
MKILKDTLQNGGKWSQKRLMTFSSFFIAAIYAFLPIFKESFDVKEFVFLGFLGAGGFSLFRTQKQNENTSSNE